MQTFLPYPDFHQSAAVLDRQRLGKQRIEAYQILRAITTSTYGWQKHPAVCMWRGYPSALAEYGRVMCDEWIRRGYKDSMRQKFVYRAPRVYPPWLGDTDFHRAHRANLVHKLPAHYMPLFGPLLWESYVWPGKKEGYHGVIYRDKIQL